MSTATVHEGDCLTVLRTLPDEGCHAMVTDPPAGIAFMGKSWDKDRGGRDQWIQWLEKRLTEVYRVLKPGSYVLVWALPRTAHWTGMAVENAGFVMRDCIIHHFGSGFPKGHDVSKAIDKVLGVEREVIGPFPPGRRLRSPSVALGDSWQENPMLTAPATDAAKQWNGWNTALKPSQEMWWLAQKPFPGTIASNVLEHGTGAMNINGCSVPAFDGYEDQWDRPVSTNIGVSGNLYISDGSQHIIDLSANKPLAGRWPPNAVFSHAALLDSETGEVIGDACADGCVEGCPVAELDRQSGIKRDGVAYNSNPKPGNSWFGQRASIIGAPAVGYGGEGGASRFFPCFRYQAKAPTSQRPVINGKAHPTVKSLELMVWLTKLVTPPGGTVLDPFAGTGTTGAACLVNQFDSILIDDDPESVKFMRARLNPQQPSLFDTVVFEEDPRDNAS